MKNKNKHSTMKYTAPWPPVLSCTPIGYVPWTNNFFLMGSNLEYWLADLSLPFFRQLKFGPNDITTVNGVFRILICYVFVVHRWYVFTCVAVCASQVLDCADGQMARRYHCGTEWGAWYDHVTDSLFGVCFMVCYMYNLSIRCGWVSLPILYSIVCSLFVIVAGTFDMRAKHRRLSWEEYQLGHRIGMYTECYMSWIFIGVLLIPYIFDLFP